VDVLRQEHRHQHGLHPGGWHSHEHPVQAKICEGLEFLGIRLDARRNEVGAPVISTRASRVTVRAIRTDEEVTIAKTVCRLLGLSTKAAVEARE